MTHAFRLRHGLLGDRYGELGYVAASTFDRYQNVPATVNYYFSDRGAFRFDDISALDLSINYRLKLGRAEFFMQPEVINVLHENAAFTGGQGILTADNERYAPGLQPLHRDAG